MYTMKPRYPNDCSDCVFLGMYGGFDLYAHPHPATHVVNFLLRYDTVDEEGEPIEKRIHCGSDPQPLSEGEETTPLEWEQNQAALEAKKRWQEKRNQEG